MVPQSQVEIISNSFKTDENNGELYAVDASGNALLDSDGEPLGIESLDALNLSEITGDVVFNAEAAGGEGKIKSNL